MNFTYFLTLPATKLKLHIVFGQIENCNYSDKSHRENQYKIQVSPAYGLSGYIGRMEEWNDGFKAKRSSNMFP